MSYDAKCRVRKRCLTICLQWLPLMLSGPDTDNQSTNIRDLDVYALQLQRGL